MTRRQRRAAGTAVIALAITLATAALAAFVPLAIADSQQTWPQDFTTLGFGVAFLVAWPVGTLLFTPRRRHR